MSGSADVVGSALTARLRLFDVCANLDRGDGFARDLGNDQLRLAWSREQFRAGGSGPRGRAANGDEYYTREADIAPARTVLGEFELDPASHPIANERVRAHRIYTIEDDALQLPWVARTVWLNPPYRHLNKFVRKLIRHYEAGDVGAAIAFISLPSIGDNWFHDINAWRFPLCIRKGRAKFDGPDGKGKSGRAGHAWMYMGPEPSRFEEAFSTLGAVVNMRAVTEDAGPTIPKIPPAQRSDSTATALMEPDAATAADADGAPTTATKAAQVNGSAIDMISEAGADDSTYAERGR